MCVCVCVYICVFVHTSACVYVCDCVYLQCLNRVCLPDCAMLLLHVALHTSTANPCIEIQEFIMKLDREFS